MQGRSLEAWAAEETTTTITSTTTTTTRLTTTTANAAGLDILAVPRWGFTYKQLSS